MPNEIFGRPLLLDIQARATGNANFVVAQQLLRASPLMQILPFKGSASLAFVYNRTNIARVGQLRAVNTDYAPKFAGGITQHTTNLAILGDAHEVDRVLGAIDPEGLQAQVAAMAPGIANRFSDLFINGRRTANALEFDGLSAIAETTGQVQTGLDLRLSDTGNNLGFRRNLGRVTAAVRGMTALGLRPVIISNLSGIGAIELAGDQLGFTAQTPDAFGNGRIPTVGGAPLLDAGMANVYGAPTTDAQGRTVYPVAQQEVIPTVTTAATASAPASTVTDIYVVGLSNTNGVTALTLDGYNDRAPVRFQTAATDAGAIRRFEMEGVFGAAVLDERAVVKFDDVVIG